MMEIPPGHPVGAGDQKKTDDETRGRAGCGVHMRELPAEFLGEMQELMGTEFPRYLHAMTDSPVRALRVNPLKASSETVLTALPDCGEAIPYETGAYLLPADTSAGRHPLHSAGAYYMQEPAAMLPVGCLTPVPGMRVLDMCAAPGGKSAQLLARIGDDGVLVSNEYQPSRCATLAGNLERMGARNVIVTNTDAAGIRARYAGFFDAAVVDAPCSGEGMFRKDPDAIGEWTPEAPARCAERQLDILNEVAETVLPGGQLVYSTCTFSYAENEGVVRQFLHAHPDYRLIPAPEAVRSATESGYAPPGADEETVQTARLSRRFYPSTGKGEGQFMAVMRRAEDADTRRAPAVRNDRQPLTGAERRVWDDFVRAVFCDDVSLPEPCLFKGAVCLSPAGVPVDARVTYACGVRAGWVEKGRFIPDHALFSAYGNRFRRIADLVPGDPNLTAYLRGDTFPTSLADGWGVVRVAGCPLGGIKVTGGVAKNHYPKGLRLRG